MHAWVALDGTGLDWTGLECIAWRFVKIISFSMNIIVVCFIIGSFTIIRLLFAFSFIAT
jgi:hypothetical protein